MSLFCYPLQICSLLRGGIAERGGVRVGHRIIEINGQSVVAVPHEKIVNLLATSVGEVSSNQSLELHCHARSFSQLSNFHFADHDEDDANVHVPATHGPRDAVVHLRSFH